MPEEISLTNEQDVTLSIPRALYDRLKARAEGTEFHSVAEYVVFVLEEVAKDDDSKSMDSEDEEKVKDNLRALGYI